MLRWLSAIQARLIWRTSMKMTWKYVLPEEGSNIWIDSWIMMKKGKNHEGAQKFLDYLCRGDVAVKNFEEIYYPTPNTAAYNSLDEEVREDPADFSGAECSGNVAKYIKLLMIRLWRFTARCGKS